ncbi:survival motor neuron protein isoform X3 [Hyposmocoma kahamanoa]|uniref:survival motor neuron protein isoform X3 n=1 Tax=Hyposmocoma kahamanoa TaxID=1477025 RepID=UPI000E6D61E0|nr:survival motor neuron protein isoform X3 [Hyposmocoma kahamanoa]
MSKSEVLYVKGNGMSDSEVEAEDDPWDDSKLKIAYDKAMRLANAVDVAQRVAMSTNSQIKQDRKIKQEKQKKHWSPKMPCRAVYEGDGLEYEAVVQKIIDDTLCLVRFIGYNNSEVVPISGLSPSLGKEKQDLQIAQANYENEDSGILTVSEPSCDRRKKLPKKKKTDKFTNGFKFPDVPMPHIPMLSQLGLNGDMPVPPPPPLAFPASRIDTEEQAMSSMLLSWYMSGYYAGLYQGLKRSKEVRNKSSR